MNNKKLESIAEKVLSKMPQDDSANYSSIITILMVISIILTVVRVLQECNKSKLSNFSGDARHQYFGEQIKQTAIRKSWFTKMMLKKTIRKELDRETYKKYGFDLMNAILDTGENLKDDELITLAEAINV